MFLTLVVLTSCIFYFVYNLRYKFLSFQLYLLTRIQGHRFKLAKTPEEIKEALMLTDKGRGIEELIATPAFDPILSLESVNGEKWVELKKNFLILQRFLPTIQQLGIVAKYEMTKKINKNKSSEFNSKDVSILTLKIFVNWMFNEVDSFNNILCEEKLNKIYKSSIEFRKQIAFKGVGSKAKKQESIDIIVELLKSSQKYKNVFHDWSQPEYFSVVMQPFIISPMINISDIAVSVKQNMHKIEKFNFDIDSFIDHAIFKAHPFPILERYNRKTQTHIFFKIEDLKEEKYNYGYGPRACLGRLYAREFLKNFFEPIIQNKQTIKFMPEKGHLYSGRDNDNGHLKESIYQLKMIAKILCSLFFERVRLYFKSISLD
ncbi:uncharacterized protein LOC136075362 [Hydra vulgaris]|uniref:Uncharacterized protein LOC136075362 n=1 Tax=Hydra vulgaris TaxID=6087 RepID=A0ABM4B6A6_HYDVU